LRFKVPKMDFLKKKHEECVNFEIGHCKVYHFINLDPKGSACPHFKAKEKKAEAKTTDAAGEN
jgi:hypothetical protein